uniref:Na(+)/H(+) exchange regulatory cofactor NHE-RF1 n=1 Tax=Meleagris gallopavo TaxID=9103 RepID=G1NA03_MELGA
MAPAGAKAGGQHQGKHIGLPTERPQPRSLSILTFPERLPAVEGLWHHQELVLPQGFPELEQADGPDAGAQELRPRLCHIKKGPNGYGFNLHSEKSRPGQYVRAVDPDSPAEAAGLRAQDRIVEVNGTSVEGKQHADVVAAIKAGGDETKLLVVGMLADEFFKKCRVVPSEAHLAGPLPEPIANGDIEKENGGEPRLNSVSERPPSPALATSPEGTETHSEPDAQEGDKRSSAPSSLLDLDIPLAVAKERAHQKRTSKRAPQMDWSKKNELFSNL